MVGADAHELKKQLLEIPLRDLDRNECSASCVRDSMEVGRGAATEVDEDGRETHLSSIKLLCLTISLGGLQTIWTAIMSQGSPYLASLGMNPSLISLVWLAGPLSGMFVQPYIGVLSDACTHSWGRRKPFIVVGTASTVICMIALPWTRDTVQFLCVVFGTEPYSRSTVLVTQALAVVWIWGMQIAIQPLQCGIRALTVDHCPAHQQVIASAYASRVIGIGSILGNSTGFLDLPSIVPWLGDTQFKGLCMVSSFAVILTVAIQCLTIREEPLKGVSRLRKGYSGMFGAFRQVLMTMKRIPRKIRRICIVQFFSWLAWFPFLYYITTYVGDLYRREAKTASLSTLPRQKVQVILASATRYGTLSLVFFAITAFITNLILPLFRLSFRRPQFNLPKLTVRRAWIISQTLASTAFFCIGLTKNCILSTIIISILGVSWALTQWAPFALIGAELAKSRSPPAISVEETQPIYTAIPAGTDNDDGDEPSLHLNSNADEDLEHHPSPIEPTIVQAGSVMGVHNMAISMPQIVAAAGSSALFGILSRWRVDGVDAMGLLFMMGVFPAGIAAWLAVGIEDD